MENVTLNKITDSELAEIKMLRGKFQEMILKFGNLQIDKMHLDKMVSDFVDNEKKLKEEWENIQKLEESLMDKISQKYGDMDLNLVDGSLTPHSIK